MIKFEFEGREFEFRGEYYDPGRNFDYYLTNKGNVEKARVGIYTNEPIARRAIVHPVEKFHDFGGVRFRETGEVRIPNHLEWALLMKSPTLQLAHRMNNPYSILKPVSILTGEEE